MSALRTRIVRKALFVLPAVCLGLLAPVHSADASPHRWRHRRAPRVVVGVRPVIVVGRPRPVRRAVFVAGRPAATIDFNVKPRATRIYIDGSLRGTAADFDGFPQKMHLAPGPHRIRLVTPDGRSSSERVVLTAGTEIDLRLDLR